MHSG